MKWCILILSLMMCLLARGETHTISEPEWRLIYGYKNPYNKAYVDNKGFEHDEDDKNYTTGTILIVFNTPNVVKRPGKPDARIKSVVRKLMIDCSSGIAAPVIDMLFSVELPKLKDTALSSKVYSGEPDTYFKFEKSSAIFLTFCPTQI